MSSIVDFTYPLVVWREGKKYLWNPIHKKKLKNRPEERVRLRVIEALIYAGWSRHRISTEEAIGELGDTSMRTDIICYTQKFEPKILIECKAERIPISAQTAQQVGRYNQKVQAPYLMMTNGINDFWYQIDSQKSGINQINSEPDFLNISSQKPTYCFEDWKDRGFAGSKAVLGLRRWFKIILPELWLPEGNNTIQFLNFEEHPTDIDISHYYRVYGLGDEHRLAVTVMGTPYGGSRLIAILNEGGENKRMLDINLDLLFEKEKKNASVYSDAGVHTFDISTHFDLLNIHEGSKLAHQLMKIFS